MPEKTTSSQGQSSTTSSYSGTCGPNARWTLNSGTLIIEGAGDMTDYTSEEAVPWSSHRNSIRAIIIRDGITSVGDYAFSYCSSATSVTFGNTVQRIGSHGFFHCSSLLTVVFPPSVRTIGDYGFAYCTSLTSVSWADQ